MNPSKNSQPQGYSSPRKFVQVLRELVANENDTRRASSRYPKRLSLMLQPLDEDFLPDGGSFFAISSDVSKRGLGLILDDPMATNLHLRITLESEGASVVGVVRHSTSIGIEYPLYLIGVEFLDEYLL